MRSPVYFLPWKAIDRYQEWIAAVKPEICVTPRDYTAIKMHFGEEGNIGFIRPHFVKPVVDRLRAAGSVPFLTDANTIYVGSRADAVHHAEVAHRHGFTIDACGCPVIIADGLRGNAGVDVAVKLKHFERVSISHAVHYADSLIFMSHFKGHEISGFGGTIKNIGMGGATRAGKFAMHDKTYPRTDGEKCTACGACLRWCPSTALSLDSGRIVLDRAACIGCGECILTCPNTVFSIPWDEQAQSVQEKIVEYAAGVVQGKRHFSISFINHVTQFCDCYPSKGKPLIDDIGIVAGPDPVAVDQAAADLVNQRFGGDFWRSIFPEIDWTVQLNYAEKVGLGSRSYELIAHA